MDIEASLRDLGCEIVGPVATVAEVERLAGRPDLDGAVLDVNLRGAKIFSVLPALLAFEVALLPAAAAGGWLSPKLRAQAAVVRELPAILRRRRAIQAERSCSAGVFAAALTPGLDSPLLAGARRLPGVARLLRLYWRAVTALLR